MLNYETIDPYPLTEHCDTLALDPEKLYTVTKMTYGRPTAEQKSAGLKWDKSRIIYNSHIILSDIPPAALEYVVNGKPALEWVMERYQNTVDPDSGIRNDPNDWSKEHQQPRYIIDLVGRVVRVSLETVKIVRGLPALNERRPSGLDRADVRAVLSAAEKLIAEKRAQGWEQSDFADALKQFFETGGAE